MPGDHPDVRWFVHVAGHEYLTKNFRFSVYNDVRRKQVLADAAWRGHDRYVASVDFSAGTCKVTYAARGTSKGSPVRLADALPKSPHLETTLGARRAVSLHTDYRQACVAACETEEAFVPEPGAASPLASIDVFTLVAAVGVEHPGSLAELAYFSHAFVRGPVLYNSWVLAGDWPGKDQGAPEPADYDPRPRHLGESLFLSLRGSVRAAYASDGASRVFGCSSDPGHRAALTQVAAAMGKAGASDATVLTVKLDDAGLDLLSGCLGVAPKPAAKAGTYTLTVAEAKAGLAGTLRDTFSGGLAGATQREVFTAPPGADALADDPGGLFHVNPALRFVGPIVVKLLGTAFSPDARGYLRMPPDLADVADRLARAAGAVP